MNVGIVGGSFNPIHLGHLITAQYICEIKKLDKIIFLPTGNAPHKKYEVPSKCRLDMLRLAIKDKEKFEICDLEINSDEVSYTYDTLRKIKDKNENMNISFIIGLDNLFNLADWHNSRELAKISDFFVAPRIRFEENYFYKAVEMSEILKNEYGFNIEFVKTPIIEISSSQIRERIKRDEDISYLTTREVVDYIKSNRLYK